MNAIHNDAFDHPLTGTDQIRPEQDKGPTMIRDFRPVSTHTRWHVVCHFAKTLDELPKLFMYDDYQLRDNCRPPSKKK